MKEIGVLFPQWLLKEIQKGTINLLIMPLVVVLMLVCIQADTFSGLLKHLDCEKQGGENRVG